MIRFKSLLLALCICPTFMAAQEAVSPLLLDITPDAQSSGMAGTGLGITDNGSASVFKNPSTLIFSYNMMGVDYTYTDINKDYGMNSASLFYKIGREGKHGFALGFRHFKNASYDMPDGKKEHARAWDLEAGYFRQMSQNLSLSATLRYMQGKAFDGAGNKSSVSVDLGASYHRNMSLLDEMASWTIGFRAANLGSKFDGQKLPAQLGLGGAIDLPFNMNNQLQVALDLDYLIPSEYRQLQAGLGAEYSFLKYGVLRGGYRIGDKEKGLGSYGTVGCGLRYWPLRVDFSYALADKDCLMHRTWQLSIGIIL